MSLSSDEVRHITNENSARFRLKLWRKSRALHQSERRIKAKRLQYNVNQPTSSREIDLRLSSSCSSIRNEIIDINIIVKPGVLL
ncbi:unnamed protein product [Protopolystoma xenopodis]|uniref:Uncharacterized protein n=1 Tax=Protopolystoma xenopodis TaxID=117903 RepID=A0A448WS08_9PLAT|nr:unnamed protein product [Protopolystoma xenopodis]